MDNSYHDMKIDDSEGTLLDLHDTKSENSSESLSGNKTCKQCGNNFTVEKEDLEFYDKISPTFAGKKNQIPTPTFCPSCRNIRRLAWRNERKLYKRKCDKSGKDIVSIYSPDKTDYKVYEINEWWKDNWDATEFGMDFDFTKPFFEQFDTLLKKVPRLSLFNAKTQNCDYVNYTAECKDSYMSSVIYYGCEKVHYSYFVYNSKNCVDISFCDKVENSYNLVGSNNCYQCNYSNRLSNCRNCYFSQDLIGCSDCILCTNLKHKHYYIRNKEYSKEEYEKMLQEMNLGSRNSVEKLFEEYKKIRENAVVKFANLLNCENCEGDDLVNCNNVKKCFSSTRVENSRYSFDQEDGKNVYDSEGGSYEWAYETNHTGFGSNYIACSGVLNSSFMYYSENCHGCRDCFGCVGLRNKKNHIFNKPYSKEEYEKMVGKIIDHMEKNGEWGEYFPISLSPFGYDETLAYDYFPKNKDEAENIGAKWQDKDYSPKYEGSFYEPNDDIKKYVEDDQERDNLLKGVISCNETKKPFKITPLELAFYIEQNIPIPQKHYDVRYKERFEMRNPKALTHCQCMCEDVSHGHEGRCKNEFETTYSPDRPEKVYCEKCYQQSVL